MLFNFVLVWLYKYFDMRVTDESYVDVLNYNPGTFDNYLHEAKPEDCHEQFAIVSSKFKRKMNERIM